jgi:hypothetical protein
MVRKWICAVCVLMAVSILHTTVFLHPSSKPADKTGLSQNVPKLPPTAIDIINGRETSVKNDYRRTSISGTKKSTDNLPA